MTRGNRFIDRIGQRYGSMVVLEYEGVGSRGDILWKCQCDCGKIIVKRGHNLPKVKTCGNTCTSIWNKQVPSMDGKGEPFGIIYKLTNKIDGKIYIGQTVFSLNDRWKRHVEYANRGGEGYLQKAIRTHGNYSFKREIVCFAFSKEQLDELEKYHICSLNTLNPEIGYNQTWRPSNDGSVRLNMSQKNMGNLNPFYRDDLKNEQFIEMYKEGFSLSEIARQLNCDRKTINYRFKQLGINIILQPNQKSLPDEEIIRIYESGNTLEEIASKYKVSSWVIRDRLIKAGISLRKHSLSRRDVKTEDLVSAYLSGTKISDLSRIHKMDRKTVRERLKQAGYTHSNKLTNCRSTTSQTDSSSTALVSPILGRPLDQS